MPSKVHPLSHAPFCARRVVVPGIANRALRRVCATFGLDEKLTAHSIRHYAATQMIANKGDSRTVADILGHADSGFTLKRYTHPDPAMLRAGADVLANAISLAHVSEDS